MITAEQYLVEVGKVALLKSNNRLVYVLREVEWDPQMKDMLMNVSYEHEGDIRYRNVYFKELETPEARMIDEARYQKFVFDLTAQVNEQAKEPKKGPELVQ